MNGEQKQPIQPPTHSKWKAFFSKKWTFPVLYMGAAALILALIMWYQDNSNLDLEQPKDLVPEISMGDDKQQQQGELVGANTQAPEAVAVNGSQSKTMGWPVAEGTDVEVVMDFYDETANEDVKAAALVQYEDSFYPHTGIDLAAKNDEAFDVIAALPGKVVRAEKDPLVGYTVEIQHENGLATVYQSLENIEVAVGDEVAQGAVLGRAGRNPFEKDLGVHLHFEVKENGQTVSPDKFLSEKKSEAQ